MCAGLKHISIMTRESPVLRIDMADSDGNTMYAKYDRFKVASEGGYYKLISVGKYSGNAGQ